MKNRRRAHYEAKPRPDWRDPLMPVTRDYLYANGHRVTSVSPEYERQLRERAFNMTPTVNWRNDPTYNMRRK